MNRLKFHWSYIFNFPFIFEIVVFLASQFLGLWIFLNYNYISNPVTDVTWGSDFLLWFLLIFFIGTLLIYLLIKKIRKTWPIKLLFYLAILDGLWIYVNTVLSWPFSFLAVLSIFGLYLYYHTIVWHDFVLIIVLASLGAMLGAMLTPWSAMLVLIILAIYDFFAVYKTKHMVKMFTGLQKKKVFFAIILPLNFQGLKTPLNLITSTQNYIFLGTGDVALPLVFAVSALKISLGISLAVIIGSLFGLIVLSLSFLLRSQKTPMPGLPFIVSGAIIGYLLGVVFL